MVNATSAEFLAESVGGGETEIGDGDAKATVKAEDVFGLQVAVINTKIVAVFDCVEHL